MLPVLAVLVTVAVVIVAPHAGPIFPTQQYQNSDGREPTPGFVWIYLAVLGAIVVFGIAMVTYQSVATARYGRTLGKRWLHIRPLRVDGSRVGWGRALGREAIYWLSTVLGWLGFLDALWCLWDGNHQCIHDKVADTIVVND